MILAQAVLQIFCWQLKQSRKMDIIQPNIYGGLPKVNQVIYTMDAICMLNIMILAQGILQRSCTA